MRRQERCLLLPTTPPSHPPLSPILNDRPGPVGGRLRSFAHLWPLVTSDKFVLETVSRGYRIEFTAKSPTTSRVWWTETPKNPSRREDLERGLQSMLDKQAIKEIPVSPETPGFYSPIFLVAKESGGFQQIRSAPILLDGDTANSHGLPRVGGSTKAELKGLKCIRNVGDLYRFKRCLFSLGRGARAYQVPPLCLQRQSLRVSGALLRSCDGVFTRIVRVIEAFLNIQGVDMHQYLDDWLMKNQSKSLVERHWDLTLFWVNKLGFLVNEGKSQLIPTQAPAFLGSTLDLLNMLVFPSKRRILRATCLAASLMARTAQPPKTWQRFLGHLSSLRELVPMAAVHRRPIQLMLHRSRTALTCTSIQTTKTSRVGRPFLHPDPTMSIVTDASKEGWGGHLGDLVVSGHWSRA